jgi:hypothetical protein
MKLTVKILLSLLFVLIAGLFATNVILKGEYDRVDKSDFYWTYKRVLEQPFKYLKIYGGNITHIAFEQSPDYSVRLLNTWYRAANEDVVKCSVQNDTLFIRFNYSGKAREHTDWWKYITAVRIFSPRLLTVEGFDTDLGMFRLKQKSINVSMSGKSKFEVESSIRYLDSLTISQKDSSEIVFEMSPDNWRTQPAGEMISKIGGPGPKVQVKLNEPTNEKIKSPEAMNIHYVHARLDGNSLLDLGHAQIDSLHLSISDSSAIILSGGVLKKYRQYGY